MVQIGASQQAGASPKIVIEIPVLTRCACGGHDGHVDIDAVDVKPSDRVLILCEQVAPIWGAGILFDEGKAVASRQLVVVGCGRHIEI